MNSFPLSSVRFRPDKSLKEFLDAYIRLQIKARKPMFPFLKEKEEDKIIEVTRPHQLICKEEKCTGDVEVKKNGQVVAHRTEMDVIGYWKVWVYKLRPLMEPWYGEGWDSKPVPSHIRKTPAYKEAAESLQREVDALYSDFNIGIILSYLLSEAHKAQLVPAALEFYDTWMQYDERVGSEKLVQALVTSPWDRSLSSLLDSLDSCGELIGLISQLLLLTGALDAFGAIDLNYRFPVLASLVILDKPFDVCIQGRDGKIYRVKAKSTCLWSNFMESHTCRGAVGPLEWDKQKCACGSKSCGLWRTIWRGIQKSYPLLQEVCRANPLLRLLWDKGHSASLEKIWYEWGWTSLLEESNTCAELDSSQNIFPILI